MLQYLKAREKDGDVILTESKKVPVRKPRATDSREMIETLRFLSGESVAKAEITTREIFVYKAYIRTDAPCDIKKLAKTIKGQELKRLGNAEGIVVTVRVTKDDEITTKPSDRDYIVTITIKKQSN